MELQILSHPDRIRQNFLKNFGICQKSQRSSCDNRNVVMAKGGHILSEIALIPARASDGNNDTWLVKGRQ
jgi:hypothetical protein